MNTMSIPVLRGFDSMDLEGMYALCVSNLDGSTGERELYNWCQGFGTLLTVRVFRHPETRQSMRSAVVGFGESHAAGFAYAYLNGLEIQPGKRLQVAFIEHKTRPVVPRSNIFVRNLDGSVDEAALQAAFAPFGNVASCKIAQDHDGARRGYGFVMFDSPQAAAAAVRAMNGKPLAGRELDVQPFSSRREREARFTNVYVRNFPAEWTDEQLSATFRRFGDIASSVVMRDAEGHGRGFGFVNFASAEAAAKAVDEADVDAGDGVLVKVTRALRKGERDGELRQRSSPMERTPTAHAGSTVHVHVHGAANGGHGPFGVNLYVKNLPLAVDDEALRLLFAPWGAVRSAKVMRNDAGESRGFGFVCYAVPDEAAAALLQMNGSVVQDKPLAVSYAENKAVRLARMQQNANAAAAAAALSASATPPTVVTEGELVASLLATAAHASSPTGALDASSNGKGTYGVHAAGAVGAGKSPSSSSSSSEGGVGRTAKNHAHHSSSTPATHPPTSPMESHGGASNALTLHWGIPGAAAAAAAASGSGAKNRAWPLPKGSSVYAKPGVGGGGGDHHATSPNHPTPSSTGRHKAAPANSHSSASSSPSSAPMKNGVGRNGRSGNVHAQQAPRGGGKGSTPSGPSSSSASSALSGGKSGRGSHAHDGGKERASDPLDGHVELKYDASEVSRETVAALKAAAAAGHVEAALGEFAGVDNLGTVDALVTALDSLAVEEGQAKAAAAVCQAVNNDARWRMRRFHAAAGGDEGHTFRTVVLVHLHRRWDRRTALAAPAAASLGEFAALLYVQKLLPQRIMVKLLDEAHASREPLDAAFLAAALAVLAASPSSSSGKLNLASYPLTLISSSSSNLEK